MAGRVIGGEDGSRSGSNATPDFRLHKRPNHNPLPFRPSAIILRYSMLSLTTSGLALAAFWMQLTTGVFPAVAAEDDTVHLTWQDGREGAYEIYYSRSVSDDGFTAPVNLSRSAGA